MLTVTLIRLEKKQIGENMELEGKEGNAKLSTYFYELSVKANSQ